MAQWTDADLGNAFDDYTGVDVDRSFGYVYNGDDIDETVSGYGANPPRVGIDFFEGPFSDLNDGIDNDRDGVIDELDTLDNKKVVTERIGLSKFIHFTNAAPPGQDDPDTDVELYNYLTGKWGNGTALTYFGSGYNTASTDFSNYSFPGTTDPLKRGLWTECSSNNKR